MARVEWIRQSGDDVEAVVAMLLCNQYPNAVRVRPSQGDGGIDVFVPGPAGFGAERAVYQVKKYSENLTSSQNRKIKRSYQRMVETSKEEGWRITEWHLVMPLDLTDKSLAWLDDVIADADFPSATNGCPVDQMGRVGRRQFDQWHSATTGLGKVEKGGSPGRTYRSGC